MTDQNPETTETDAAKKERSDNLRKAYSNANTRLREAHREEFETLYVAEANKFGIDYKPKPTKEEKARENLRSLLADNPGLRDDLKAELAQQG